MNQRRDASSTAAFASSIAAVLSLIVIAFIIISIAITIVLALIPIYLPTKQINAVCPVNCNNSCTRLCLRNFAQCNPQSKRITIVTTNDQVPFISQNGTNSPTGFDVDLMSYIADLIGVKFTYEYKTFAELLSTVQNDTNTISISVQTDTVAREEFVNFAQYFQTGGGFLVKADSALSINGLSDLCGKSVVALTGSIFITDLQTQNGKCGSNPITIISVPTITEARTAVLDGSAQVGLDDEALLAYYASQSNNQVKVVGQFYDVAPYGILCNQQNQALCCSLVNAINYLIQQGTYQALFPKYSFNYTENGICPSRLNLDGTTCTSSCVPSNSICTS